MFPIPLTIAIALGVMACWNIVNFMVTFVVMATKQLVPADRGIALYFLIVSLLTSVACGAGAYQLLITLE